MMNRQKIKKRVEGTNIYIFYRKEDDTLKIIEKYSVNIIKKLKDFYGTSDFKINIELFYSRKELNKKFKRKTLNWLAGTVVGNKICLFSLLVMEKESCHKNSEFNKILTHEICHVFNSRLNKNPLMWVDEGVALFLASQKKDKNFTKNDLEFFLNNFFGKNIRLEAFSRNNGYKISYWMVKMIVKLFGREKLLKFIKIISGGKNNKQILEKNLGMPVNNFFEKIKPPFSENF